MVEEIRRRVELALLYWEGETPLHKIVRDKGAWWAVAVRGAVGQYVHVDGLHAVQSFGYCQRGDNSLRAVDDVVPACVHLALHIIHARN